MSSESPSSIRFHGVIPVPPLTAAASATSTTSATTAVSSPVSVSVSTWAEPSSSQTVSPLSRGRSVCGSGHVHGPDCGHTQIQHIDHIGYLHDGRLHCMVNQQCVEHKLVDDVDSCLPGRKLSSNAQGCNDHGHAHGHSHGARQSVPVPVPVPVAVSASSHAHTHATDDDHDHDHTPNHDHHHDHSDTCGHELIMHGDHYDYLVGSQLHHVGDGQCQVHGSLRKRNLTYIEVSSIDDEKSKPRVSRRHEMLLEKQALLRRGDSKGHKERWYDNRDSRRFAMMVGLTGSYFLVELIFGIYLSSLALVADAMHMLSDLMALVFGFYAVEAAKRERTAKSTYGGSRWEVVGGLLNGAFLLGLCFTIVIEAITRFTEPINQELEKEGTTIIIVAGVGLGINLIGMVIFGHGHGHGHSHGGHGGHDDGHAHGGHGHSHGGHDDGRAHAHGNDEHEDDHDRLELGTSKKQTKAVMNVNIHGAFLHIMGDALGSIGVLISGLIVQYTSYSHRTLADPAASLIIALLIFSSTIPLLRICCNVLLQQTPHDMNTEQIRQQLRSIEGVLQIHELHIWQLTTVKIVATMHVVLYEGTNFMNVCDEMKLLMHAAGVHSTTIQPEFIPKSKCLSHTSGSMDLCHEPVCGASDCFEKACCVVQPITAA